MMDPAEEEARTSDIRSRSNVHLFVEIKRVGTEGCYACSWADGFGLENIPRPSEEPLAPSRIRCIEPGNRVIVD